MCKLISVIVPVYKVEPYLCPCVDSILAQTYTDFELILVDDGSPDNCGAICDAYAAQDSRVRVIHQKNGGLSAARNTGLDAASGSYVTFIDSDDLILPNYLEKLYSALAENSADTSVCGHISFEDGTEPHPAQPSQCLESTIMSGRDACLSIYQMDGKVPVMAWGKLYKISLFQDIRYPIGMIHEDDATTPQLLYRAKNIVLVPDQLYGYRSRTGSIMNQTFSQKNWDAIKAVDLCINYFTQTQDEEIVQFAKVFRSVTQSKLNIKARSSHAASAIPDEFKISEFKSLRIIRKYTLDDIYCWYLTLLHPSWERPHAHLRKIKQILGFQVK